MISKIIVITSSGILCYSKMFFGPDKIDDDLISGFLTAISNIAKEIGGGEIRSLHFRKFNFIYSYDDERICMFIIVADIKDPEEEVRERLELLKVEFIKRFHEDLINWDSEIYKFKIFDEFAEKNIFIPPKVLLIGEEGVGKSTIMNLFPGETILELDDDLNEIIQKPIHLPVYETINQISLREIDMKDLIDNSKIYRSILDTVDIICIVTNSGASNLGRTKKSCSILQKKVKKADFYIIANFQDLKSTSFEPEKVEELFGMKAFGFSAIDKSATNKIYEIFNEMLKISLIEKNERILHLE
ncbi:MAG: hypothetical protein ACXABO_01205 [Promethearchaeota archaeon]|jgi:tRNA U34 5-carboxymethylaminomethyl modifying GTPase MnmE/TrmE